MMLNLGLGEMTALTGMAVNCGRLHKPALTPLRPSFLLCVFIFSAATNLSEESSHKHDGTAPPFQ